MDSAKEAARALVPDPAYDSARPQCLLCNPEPGRRYTLTRVKVISELGRARWKYALSTITADLCEKCIDAHGILEKLAANEDRKAAKQKRDEEALKGANCPECGDGYESVADMRNQYCFRCSQSPFLLPSHFGSLVQMHDFVLRNDLSRRAMTLTLPDGLGQWEVSYDGCEGRNGYHRFLARLNQTITFALDQTPQSP